MMILSLLAASTITHFGGGTPNDLAKTLADATGQNVVIYQARMKPIPAFDFDTASLDEFAKTMRTKAGLMMAPGSNYIFYDGVLPAGKMPPRYQAGGGSPN